ncbi:MAG: ATP-binding protein, partial [Bacteroidota bacterium]|nr:ATP-binding protein [Bacteroidota bacterium]
MAEEKKPQNTYTDDSIITLEDNEHIRRRVGMYIGRLGNGDDQADGIYVLLKEIIDNSIDEFSMGHGTRVNINIAEDGEVTVRDFGRGIPLTKVVDATSKLNTGGKFDDRNFKKSVGMNGVGTKAVNALSSVFEVRSYREGQCSYALFSRGELQEQSITPSGEKDGTMIRF